MEVSWQTSVHVVLLPLQKASASQGNLQPFGFTVPLHGGQDIILYPTQTSSSVNVTEMNSFFS